MIGRVAYGALFTVALPLALVAWSMRLSTLLPAWPIPGDAWRPVGALLLVAGLLLTAWSMGILWRVGRGLPMNAYPPPTLVEAGPYRLLPHPIYVGFALACFGIAMLARSPGGLWVVAPSATLAALALGAGHETPDLRRRFGRAPRTLLGGVGRGAAAALQPAWRALLRVAERIANSWSEWRVGPLRIINHGLYAGAAAALGAGIVLALVGTAQRWDVVVVALASLIGAAAWGQYWVGSATLLRPFGYFGSVLAILLVVPGLALAGRSWVDLWALAAAASTAAPWVQCVGRLRCLVQGCCHGAPIDVGMVGSDRGQAGERVAAPSTAGIVYRHPRSRVCWVSGLAGVALHPTPVYSMAANVPIGILLAILWWRQAPTSLILGTYLMLEGAARFVEESRRGEVTTPVRSGLRLYQWFAAGILLVGALVTCAASPPAPLGAAVAWPALAVTAGLVGLVHWLAMGVDLPGSHRRFGRLV